MSGGAARHGTASIAYRRAVWRATALGQVSPAVRTGRGVQLVVAKVPPVLELGHDPALGPQDRRLELWLAWALRHHGGVVLGGQISIGAVDGRILEAGRRHSGLEIVRHDLPERTAKERECPRVAGDPVGRPMTRSPRHSCSWRRREPRQRAGLPRGVDHVDRRPRIGDERAFPGGMALAHHRVPSRRVWSSQDRPCPQPLGWTVRDSSRSSAWVALLRRSSGWTWARSGCGWAPSAPPTERGTGVRFRSPLDRSSGHGQDEAADWARPRYSRSVVRPMNRLVAIRRVDMLATASRKTSRVFRSGRAVIGPLPGQNPDGQRAADRLVSALNRGGRIRLDPPGGWPRNWGPTHPGRPDC